MRADALLSTLALTLLSLGLAAPALAADDAMTGKINNGTLETHVQPPRLNQGLGPDSLGDATSGTVHTIEPANPGPQGHDAAAGATGVGREAADAAARPANGPPGASPETMPSSLSAKNAADDRRSWIQRELNLSENQKHAIAQELAASGAKSGGSSTTGSDAPGSTVWVGNVLPYSVNLRDFPQSLTTRLPELAGLQYVKLVDRILIVDPSERVVVSEVSL